MAAAATMAGYLDRMDALLRLHRTLDVCVYSFFSTDSYSTTARRARSELDALHVRLQHQEVRFRGWIGTLSEQADRFQAALTVTDDGGASSQDTVSVAVELYQEPGTVHVGDLDGYSKMVRNKWQATVTITVHDAGHDPVANATVSGVWSGGATGGAECTTDFSGQCSVVKTNLKARTSSVTFTVSSVPHASYTYDATANHDPEGDSDGTSITVDKP